MVAGRYVHVRRAEAMPISSGKSRDKDGFCRKRRDNSELETETWWVLRNINKPEARDGGWHLWGDVILMLVLV